MRTTADQLRADARSNRDQILRAALEVFCERGANVPMKDIADRAGVGVGTLYRRFPDRDALLTATAAAHMANIVELVTTARREEPTAWSALCRVLRECAEMQLGAQAAAIEPAAHQLVKDDPAVTKTRNLLFDQLRQLIDHAHTDGDLRPDIGLPDIEVLMMLQIPAHTESRPDTVDRVVGIILDGIRAQGDSRS
ncbi:TetR/AcrR family transcriptional regulator [Nocardia sp. NPDC020380]|uniref:TetR/AcrR family transcriptional regulator n=1 Tax=Nocardia sp. NPDC020380 TaxID=3364309 RepID=UPI00379B7A62